MGSAKGRIVDPQPVDLFPIAKRVILEPCVRLLRRRGLRGETRWGHGDGEEGTDGRQDGYLFHDGQFRNVSTWETNSFWYWNIAPWPESGYRIRWAFGMCLNIV